MSQRHYTIGKQENPANRKRGIKGKAEFRGEMTMTVRTLKKKITLLGDPQVGKTSLIHRYVYDVFNEKYLSTFGAKITKKDMLFAREEYPSLLYDTRLTLLTWDIAGQKAFENIHKTYYRGAEGALVVCDITRQETLDNIREWIGDLYSVVGRVPTILLINKCDLKDQYSFGKKRVREVLAGLEVPCFTTSAKTGHNVEKAFTTVARLILQEDVETIRGTNPEG